MVVAVAVPCGLRTVCSTAGGGSRRAQGSRTRLFPRVRQSGTRTLRTEEQHQTFRDGQRHLPSCVGLAFFSLLSPPPLPLPSLVPTPARSLLSFGMQFRSLTLAVILGTSAALAVKIPIKKTRQVPIQRRSGSGGLAISHPANALANSHVLAASTSSSDSNDSDLRYVLLPSMRVQPSLKILALVPSMT